MLCLDSEGALSGFSFQLIGLPVRVLSGCLLPSYRDVRTRKARIRAVLVVTNRRARCVAFCADDRGRWWTEQGRLCDLGADRARAVRTYALFRRPFQQLFSTHYTVRMSYERRQETPILWCWLSIEADPSVLILGGVRRVISRRVEAVLIGHARHPSNRVAVETLLRLWYSERGRRDWGPRNPVLQGDSSWT